MRLTKSLLSVAFVLLFGFSVFGQLPQSAAKMESQSVNTPGIITSMTLESFQRIVQGMGFDCTRDKDEKGNLESYFIFRAEGYKVGAQLVGDSVWLYNMFTDGATLESINEWNQNNRFSRASFNVVDKSLLLDTDIIFKGGVTGENVEAQVKQFRDSVSRWARFIVDHQKPATPPTPAAQKQ